MERIIIAKEECEEVNAVSKTIRMNEWIDVYRLSSQLRERRFAKEE